MIKQIRKLLISFQFLTILPVKIQGDIYDDIAGSTVFFPVVGAFQGAVIVLFAMILRYAFCKGAVCHIYDGIISVLIILILIATNKGLHIDGLADTFDALGIISYFNGLLLPVYNACILKMGNGTCNSQGYPSAPGWNW